VIVGLERRALRFFTGPMCMGEPVRVHMCWIAIVDVKKRSLSEGEQEARGDAKMDCAPHFLALYLDIRVGVHVPDVNRRHCARLRLRFGLRDSPVNHRVAARSPPVQGGSVLCGRSTGCPAPL